MDDFRRRPTMEGFTRPGSFGGEAWNDDDSVEGHIMSDDLRRDEDDTEGHGALKRGPLKRVDDEEDVEGHGLVRRGVLKRADEDDTEGHGSTIR
jgi:hypothetical protein